MTWSVDSVTWRMKSFCSCGRSSWKAIHTAAVLERVNDELVRWLVRRCGVEGTRRGNGVVVAPHRWAQLVLDDVLGVLPVPLRRNGDDPFDPFGGRLALGGRPALLATGGEHEHDGAGGDETTGHGPDCGIGSVPRL